MRFDSIIIGGGIAGMTCAIRCAEKGLSCAVISSGMSALHFASGSIDLLGRFPSDSVVTNPFDQMPDFINHNPEHPYARCGEKAIADSLQYFTDQLQQQSLQLCNNGRQNHFHLTTYGTLTPTYLSQKSVYSPELEKAFFENQKMALISFEGFRDFHVPLISANLPGQTLFQNRQVTTGTVDLSPLIRSQKNPHEFRSIDISRMLETDEDLQKIADHINELAGDAGIIGLPACLGFIHHASVYEKLQRLVGRPVYEIPTLPPSILGMRLDHALKTRFSNLGGVFIAGDKVVRGEMQSGKLSGVYTENHGKTLLKAGSVVLASGSFFSGGLISDSAGIREPVFNLDLTYEKDRKQWARGLFFQPESHQFLEFGVKTNEQLNPFDSSGHLIDNLYCAGAILAGYNPIREGSGGGVAISTGYTAAEMIIGRTASTGAARP